MPLTSNVSVTVTFGNGLNLTTTFIRPQNDNAPGVADWKLFPVGFNQLTIPPGITTGLLIIPREGNLSPIALVGDNNDDGVPLHPSEVSFISLPNTPKIGLKITTAPVLIRLIWV